LCETFLAIEQRRAKPDSHKVHNDHKVHKGIGELSSHQACFTTSLWPAVEARVIGFAGLKPLR
jgi:hypothetical protein